MPHARLWSVCLALVLSANLAVAWHLRQTARETSGEAQAARELGTFTRVLRLVRQQYVDADKVGYPALIRGAIQGMLATLDANTGFLPPPDALSMREEADGEFGGIGVHISTRDDQLTILAPMTNSPGHRAGLRPRDRVLAVDGEEITGLSLNDAVRKIKGRPGTPVRLRVLRPDTGELLELPVVREIIEVNPINGQRLLEPGIGYAHLSTFSLKSASSLWEAMEALRREDMKVLVLDLRHNGGGILGMASEICGYFLPTGTLVVSTEGRVPSNQERITADNGPKAMDLGLVILINEASASASEIVAGCLQDYGRAIVVGQRSYGKGSVQKIMELGDAGALRLTVARYFTPSRRPIDGHGIVPDVEVRLSDEDSLRLFEARGRAGNGTTTDSPPHDPQLGAALEVARRLLASVPGTPAMGAPPAP